MLRTPRAAVETPPAAWPASSDAAPITRGRIFQQSPPPSLFRYITRDRLECRARPRHSLERSILSPAQQRATPALRAARGSIVSGSAWPQAMPLVSDGKGDANESLHKQELPRVDQHPQHILQAFPRVAGFVDPAQGTRHLFRARRARESHQVQL